LVANRAAMRMRSRQQYRTMARMQRRRSFVQDRMGARQDFQPAGAAEEAPPESGGGGDYTAELERLAQLRDDGVITDADFEAKKKQVLGI
jgi:hypothetical protein